MSWNWEYRNEDHPKLAKLRKALCAAEGDVRTMTDARQEYIDKAEDQWDADHGADLSDLQAEAKRAADAVSAEVGRIRLAESVSLLPYPEGTVVEEMRREKHSWSGPSRPTGKKGVIQVFRAGDKYPENLSAYSAPEVGSVVVRELKKDGSPSLVVKKLAGWSHWYKDGKLVQLKEKKEVTDAEV